MPPSSPARLSVSRTAEPSSADTRITDELQQALAMVDVRLLDHFVVGEGRPVSFAERGLLSPPQPRLFG